VRRCATGALAALVAAAGASAGGCGSEAPDLFLVTRTGSIPGARLTVRVTDDGRASCNRRALVEIASSQLITAREAQRDLAKPAERHLRLAPGPRSVLSYRVRSEDGTVTWSDTSRRQPHVLFVLAALTRQIARGPCHLPR
jgi:hypothetical protein